MSTRLADEIGRLAPSLASRNFAVRPHLYFAMHIREPYALRTTQDGLGLFIRPLTPGELPNYLEHLLRLDPADRRMRFGFPISDTGIRAYVQRIDLRTGHILALFDDDLDVVAAAHIVRAGDDVAEFAFSVDREWRGCGVGSELFDRAVLWARNRGIRQAIVYCLNENQAMRHIARKAGVQMTVAAGEIEGRLELLPATPFEPPRRAGIRALGMARSVTQAHRLVLVSTRRADGRSGLKERAARRAHNAEWRA